MPENSPSIGLCLFFFFATERLYKPNARICHSFVASPTETFPRDGVGAVEKSMGRSPQSPTKIEISRSAGSLQESPRNAGPSTFCLNEHQVPLIQLMSICLDLRLPVEPHRADSQPNRVPRNGVRQQEFDIVILRPRAIYQSRALKQYWEVILAFYCPRLLSEIYGAKFETELFARSPTNRIASGIR